MQRKSFALGTIFCALCIAVLPGAASADGLFGGGCGLCNSGYGWGQIYYTSPTYTYAPPTVTVIPHYIVQPNYIMERTYLVRPTEYLQESAGCSPCGGAGYLANQGQYSVWPAFFSGSL